MADPFEYELWCADYPRPSLLYSYGSDRKQRPLGALPMEPMILTDSIKMTFAFGSCESCYDAA